MKHHTYESHYIGFDVGVGGIGSDNKDLFLRDSFEALRYLTSVDRGAIIITKNCEVDQNHRPIKFVDSRLSCGPRPLRKDDV